MFERLSKQSFGITILGFALLFGSLTLGRAEEKQLGNKDLEAEFGRIPFGKRGDLLTGKIAIGPAELNHLEIMSRYYAYRVTWASAKNNPKEMEKLHEQLERELVALVASAAKGRYVAEPMGKYMAKTYREVLTLDFDDNRLAVLNGALMLPVLSRMKQDEVGDLLVDMLKDKNRHDVVKHYAAKSMREFFPIRITTDDDDLSDAKVRKKMTQDINRVNALTEFIERKWPTPETDAEREAIRFMRREAVISLAQAGAPAAAAIKKKEGKVVEGLAAAALLRVLVRDKGMLDPPPSLHERVEAALGLCQLKNPTAAGYDPSVGVYAVGLCFYEFASVYSKDYVNIQARKDLKNFPPGSKIPTMHWRITAERFKQGVKDLVVNTKDTPAYAGAQRLEKDVTVVANDIRNYQQVQNSLPPFLKMVETLKPKTGQLYQAQGPQIEPASLKGVVASTDDD